MKVAMVILRGDRHRGGAERYTVACADALIERGHDVTLVAETFEAPGLAKQLPIRRRGLTRAKRFANFTADAAKATAAGFDIVHAATPLPGCDIYHLHAGFASLRQRITLGKRRLAARLERDMLTSGRPKVLCLSDRERRRGEGAFGNDLDVVTLRLGVDLAHFDPDTPGEEPYRFADGVTFLFVAQNFAIKGLDTALAAVERVPKARLLVVGGDNPKRWREQAAPLGDRVRFTGAINDPVPAFRSADAVLMPTRTDTFGLYVVEAVAMHRPLIVGAEAGAVELITDGEHGYVLHDVADVASCAGYVEKLCDPAERCRIAKACATLRPTLSWDEHMDKLIRIYGERAR